ncbi:type II secretion system protein [Tautonia marina]|uniref:type II secretion system protein n=1 Tax=Tautonia marina TaxID=2653855 RepID=UPI001260E358|nr:prepilin-type N-terminal cleavage/methylation domain-containing protein [Tautonia marina]
MTPAERRRTGFTLVELLVVITIIGVLIGLLIPVIWSAVGRANDARVGGEINTLAQALASFQNKFGDYPPSRIILAEDGGYDSAAVALDSVPFYAGMSYQSPAANIGGNPQVVTGVGDQTYAALAQKSISVMRKFFSKTQFSTGPAASGIVGGYYDFNGNGVLDANPIYLEGHECLAFFLGGIPTHTIVGSTYTLEGVGGFGGNPRNPFRPAYLPDGTLDPVGQNRSEPFFEFRAERLVDDDFDGIPGYIDPLGEGPAGRYFAYFSSYGGQGYDPNDVNFNAGAISEPNPVALPFSVSFPVLNGVSARVTGSPLPNPYTSSLPVATGDKPATFHQPQSYQIISAGRDRLFGTGGQYSSSGTGDRLPGDGRTRERDNVTNISNGTLD